MLSNETFADVVLPNHGGFILDDRLETEHSKWVGEPCMENCKEDVKVTMRAMVLDVTPDEDKGEAAPAVVEDAPVVEEAKVEETAAEEVAALDPELVAAGAKVFKKCKACHQVGDGARNKTGPVLNGIVGQAAGTVEGFKYSKALKAKAEEGLVWTDENMTEFLKKPKAFMKGTKMSFAGLKKEKDLMAITAYLTSLGN